MGKLHLYGTGYCPITGFRKHASELFGSGSKPFVKEINRNQLDEFVSYYENAGCL
jgi:hypothetical protein